MSFTTSTVCSKPSTEALCPSTACTVNTGSLAWRKSSRILTLLPGLGNEAMPASAVILAKCSVCNWLCYSTPQIIPINYVCCNALYPVGWYGLPSKMAFGSAPTAHSQTATQARHSPTLSERKAPCSTFPQLLSLPQRVRGMVLSNRFTAIFL